MNRISKTMRKGFTLMELMVVMAIMSILLVAVMSMTTPASRIFKRTAVSDNVYSAADNITGYLQRTLEYADNVWIMDSNTDEIKSGTLQDTAIAFQKCYYNYVIKGTSETTWKYVQSKVHILHLSNQTGQITETVYKFADSSSTAMPTKEKDDVPVLNENYFKGDYADYNFRYVLGATSLEPVLESSGERKMSGSEIIYCLKSEKDGDMVQSTIQHQAITLVANRSKIKPQKVDGVYEFVGPCVATVANLPFTNIQSRRGANGVNIANQPVYRLVVPDGGTEIHSQNEPIDSKYRISYSRSGGPITSSFANLATGNPITVGDGSTPNDIYFVFAYADELIAKP